MVAGPVAPSGPRRGAACPGLREAHHSPVILGVDAAEHAGEQVVADVEKTMIEIQRKTIVRETRNEFQNAMQDTFIEAVERLSGRNVLAFISNHQVGPDLEIELFLLTPDRTSDERAPVVPEPDAE